MSFTSTSLNQICVYQGRDKEGRGNRLAIDKGYEVEALPQPSGIGLKEALLSEFDPEPD